MVQMSLIFLLCYFSNKKICSVSLLTFNFVLTLLEKKKCFNNYKLDFDPHNRAGIYFHVYIEIFILHNQYAFLMLLTYLNVCIIISNTIIL